MCIFLSDYDIRVLVVATPQRSSKDRDAGNKLVRIRVATKFVAHHVATTIGFEKAQYFESICATRHRIGAGCGAAARGELEATTRP